MDSQTISTLESGVEQDAELVRFPMDGLLRLLKQPGCYCLGVTELFDNGKSSRRNRVGSIARRCAERSGRKTLWVSDATESGGIASTLAYEPDSEPAMKGEGPSGLEGVDCLHWGCLSEGLVMGTPLFRQAMAELAELPQLRQRYELIVIDLGGLNSAGMARVGKLCDGVVLLCDSGTDASRAWSRHLAASAKAIRQCQHEGMRFVGAWSLLAGR